MKTLIVFFTLASVAYCAVLPSFFHKCTKADFFSADGRCILQEANRIKAQLTKGIPELGIEETDPLRVDQLVLKSGPLTITQNNVLFKGLSKCDVKGLSIDEKKNTGQIHLYGNFTMKSDYEMTGRLILLDLSSKGKSVIKMENTDMILKFKWRLEKKADGKDYFQANIYKHQVTFGNVRMKMDKLLGNDKLLSDTINQLLNENWRDLMKDFGPPAVEGVSAKVDTVLNKFYGQVPFNEELFKE